MINQVPYSAHFLSFPIIIQGTGQYITRSGETVDITDDSDYHFKQGQYSCGTKETWHKSGRIFCDKETSFQKSNIKMTTILASDNEDVKSAMQSLQMSIGFSKTRITLIEEKKHKDFETKMDLRYHRHRMQVMGKFYKNFRKAIQIGMTVNEFEYFVFMSIINSDPMQFNIDKCYCGYVDVVKLFDKLAETNQLETPYFFRRGAIETAVKFNHTGRYDGMLSAYRKWNMAQRVFLQNEINSIRSKITNTYF